MLLILKRSNAVYHKSSLGRLFLQLLPLVSNKHLISLSLWRAHRWPCVSECSRELSDVKRQAIRE